jgi:cell division cycle 14
MYFDDGSNPSEEILRDFIALADAQIAAGRVVAVHCKAGLGRTGVLIGAYLIWRHGFSASEVIGFMRFMRPGCVVGPQQHFMYENATEWVRWRVRHEMRLELAKELAEVEAKAATATAASAAAGSVNELRTSRKRSADEHDGETEGDAASAEQPTTPRNKRANLAPPVEAGANTSGAGSSTGAPAVKPTPCVGQPRKSPSPARKRPANQARAPSGASSRVPSAGSVRAGHAPGPSALAAPAPAAAPTPRAPGTGYMPRSVSDESIRAAAAAAAAGSASSASSGAGASSSSGRTHGGSNSGGARVPGTPGPSARLEAAALAAPGTPGRVLGEAQRLNVQAGVGIAAMPHTPPTSGTSVLARVKAATVGRVRHGHERSRSALAGAATFAPPSALEDVFLDSLPASLPAPDTPTTPRSLASRMPTFRASPLIKSKYGLRDTSEDAGAENLAPAPASAPVSGAVKAAPSSQHARSQTAQPRSGSGSASLDARRKASGGSTRSAVPSTSSSNSSSTGSTRGAVRAATSRYAAPTAASTAAATAARRARLDPKAAPHPYAAGRTAVPAALPHVQRIGRSVRGRRSSVGEADCV